MPKYYIQDDVQGWIIDGKRPVSLFVLKGIYLKMIDSFQFNTKTNRLMEVICIRNGFDDPKR